MRRSPNVMYPQVSLCTFRGKSLGQIPADTWRYLDCWPAAPFTPGRVPPSPTEAARAGLSDAQTQINQTVLIQLRRGLFSPSLPPAAVFSALLAPNFSSVSFSLLFSCRSFSLVPACVLLIRLPGLRRVVFVGRVSAQQNGRWAQTTIRGSTNFLPYSRRVSTP